MIHRENKEFDLAVKSGIETSVVEDKFSALKLMERAGLPSRIINRVLFEQHRLRDTDQYILRRMHLS